MSVLISNIDDFVNPSQACIIINPLTNDDAKSNKKVGVVGGSSKIKVDMDTSIPDDFANFEASTSSITNIIPISNSIKQPDLLKIKKNKNNVEVATVSLSDCLACSGCVTSAESVLIEEHGYSKLLSKLEDIKNKKETEINTEIVVEQVVVSISPQSLVSLTLFLNNSVNTDIDLDTSNIGDSTTVMNNSEVSNVNVKEHMLVEEVFLRLSSLLKSIGVLYVIDTTAVNEVVLLEAAEEFLFRYRQQSRNTVGVGMDETTPAPAPAPASAPAPAPALTKGKFRNTKPKPRVSNAISSTRVQWIDNKGNGTATTTTEEIVGLVTRRGLDSRDNYPVLTSHCPGFVCYAEKQQPEMLSNISTVKSSQQVIGSILKENSIDMDMLQHITGVNNSSNNKNNSKKAYYHVSIQPCFDKKLEASRKDFYHETNGTAEVDLVLSTTELWNMMTHLLTTSNTETETIGTGKGTGSCGIKSASIASVWDYLHTFPCDSIQGIDAIECMLRGNPTSTSEPNIIINSNSNGNSNSNPYTGTIASGNTSTNTHTTIANLGSGGFIEFCARYSAHQLWGLDLWDTPLCYLPGITNNRTKPLQICNTITNDYCECIISNKRGVLGIEDMMDRTPLDSSEQYLVFVKAYGFRGIQSMATKIKRYNCYASNTFRSDTNNTMSISANTKLPIDFIEVMACPSGGCLNGGGQLKASHKETTLEMQKRVIGVDKLYHTHTHTYWNHRMWMTLPLPLNHEDTRNRNRIQNGNPFTKFVYHSYALEGDTSISTQDEDAISLPLLHTRYHAVPKLEILSPLATKW